jgi:hypothetical protein
VTTNDLGWLDAVALRDLVAAGEVTPAEVAEGAIARIEAADPVLNAVVVPLPDIGPAQRPDRSSSLRCGRSVLTRSLTRRCPHGGRKPAKPLVDNLLTEPAPSGMTQRGARLQRPWWW